MDIIKWLGITDRHKKMYLNKRLAPFGLSSQHLYLLKVCRNPGITQDQFLESFYLNPSNGNKGSSVVGTERVSVPGIL